MDQPLAGLRVLDFSRLLPGPYCTLLLRELGAQVVKVEDTQSGDLTRHFPPLVDGCGAIFTFLNRNKQSVALDLKSLDGQAIAQELAAHSDVVVEGFRPGVASRLGIDLPSLAARNRRLVYCSISGYGQEGVLRNLPGHDLNYAAVTGLLDVLSPGAPRVPGVQLVDAAGALLAALRILAALHGVSDQPQYLDVSLTDGARALMPVITAEALAGPSFGRSIVDLLRGSPRNDLYRCADGRWLALSPVEEPFWERLCAVLEQDGAIQPGASPTTERLRAVFLQRDRAAWLERLTDADLPCAPVCTVWEDLEHRGAIASGRAPLLGEHTRSWLQALGYPPDRIAELERRRIIRIAPGSPSD